MYTVFMVIVLIFIIYSLLPTVLYRLFSLGMHSCGLEERQIAITFDDGPDPNYTPKLLDLLKENNVKATFFVVGERAKRFPDVIKRIHNEGHEIGIHHYHHISNWILPPTFIKKQCQLTADVVEDLTGARPVYYRPPWGHMNLFVHFGARPFTMVLWSVIPGDWKVKIGASRLAKKINKSVKNGSVIVLHDCGDTLGADHQAPGMMIEALREFLNEHPDKFEFVTVDAMFKCRREKENALP